MNYCQAGQAMTGGRRLVSALPPTCDLSDPSIVTQFSLEVLPDSSQWLHDELISVYALYVHT